MKVHITRLSALVFLLFSLYGCISQKKLNYLQDPVKDQNTYNLQTKPANVIKPNDELYINVTSFDDASFNFFRGSEDYSRTGFSNELSVHLISYTVGDDGTIYFPIIGSVLLAGLTIDEARQKLMDMLVSYFNQPIVVIKIAYKKITILGEVRSPGDYTYSKDRINIFEAIGMAGDLTIHGDRKEVYLLRHGVDNITKSKLDLTKDKLLFSQYYYIQPDDIIYVKARESLKWNVISVPITLLLTSISTTILVINFVQNY